MLSAGGKIRDGFCNIHETRGNRTELLARSLIHEYQLGMLQNGVQVLAEF